MRTLFAIAVSSFLVLCSFDIARADDAQTGKPIYMQQCMVCHGVSGKGDGPAGKNLNPKPTDFTAAVPDDARWFKATKLGTKAIGKSNAMGGSARTLTDQQIRDVLAYAKTLKKS